MDPRDPKDRRAEILLDAPRADLIIEKAVLLLVALFVANRGAVLPALDRKRPSCVDIQARIERNECPRKRILAGDRANVRASKGKSLRKARKVLLLTSKVWRKAPKVGCRKLLVAAGQAETVLARTNNHPPEAISHANS